MCTASGAIVTFNDGQKAVNACKSLIENTKRIPFSLYVFDNASADGTAKQISEISEVTVFENKENIGFGAAHNLALEQQIGKYHFVINPDITVDSDVISDMVDFMEKNPDIVMAMPQILFPDGSIQYLPKEVPTFKRLFLGRLFKKTRSEYVWQNRELTGVTDIDFCSGCFFCIRGEAFKKLGGFDKRYFMYLEDADLTLRAKKFGRTVINPEITVVHKWERSSAKSIKYLFIHTLSAFKFLLRKGKIL